MRRGAPRGAGREMPADDALVGVRSTALLAGSLLDVRCRPAPVPGAHGVDDTQRPRQRELNEGEQESQETGLVGKKDHLG